MAGAGGKKNLAVLALAEGLSIRAAAKRVGVASDTIDSWLRQPDFRASIDQALGAIFEASIREIVQARSAAIRTLIEIAQDDCSPASSRVGAARALIEGADRGYQIYLLGRRLDALESQLGEGGAITVSAGGDEDE